MISWITYWPLEDENHSEFKKTASASPSVNTPAAAIKRAFKLEMRRASHNHEETDGEEKKGRGREEQKDCVFREMVNGSFSDLY